MHDNMKAPDFYSIHLGHTNCFLLRLETGYLLIDTSFPQYYGKFEKFINKKGIKLSDIKYLLLTHHHDDHAGFAQALRKDSKTVPLIGGNGKILHTIGHTHYRPIFVSDIKEVKHSWDIIINNGSKMLFPSHGKRFSTDKLEKSKMKYMSKQ